MVVAIYAVLLWIPHKDHVSVSEVALIFVCVPRLHDLGKSGWWAVIPLIVEIVSAALAFSLLPFQQAAEVMCVVVLVIAGLMILLGLIPGQAAANGFGEPPRPGLSLRRAKSVVEVFD